MPGCVTKRRFQNQVHIINSENLERVTVHEKTSAGKISCDNQSSHIHPLSSVFTRITFVAGNAEILL